MDHPRDAGASVPFCQSSTREYKPREPFSHVKPPTEWRGLGPGLHVTARPSPRNYRTPHSGVSQPGIGHNEGTRPGWPGITRFPSHMRPTCARKGEQPVAMNPCSHNDGVRRATGHPCQYRVRHAWLRCRCLLLDSLNRQVAAWDLYCARQPDRWRPGQAAHTATNRAQLRMNGLRTPAEGPSRHSLPLNALPSSLRARSPSEAPLTPPPTRRNLEVLAL